jgi:hypothetical protein
MDGVVGVGDKLQLEPSLSFGDGGHTYLTADFTTYSPKNATSNQNVMIGVFACLLRNHQLWTNQPAE